jgi:hypothetical protein
VELVITLVGCLVSYHVINYGDVDYWSSRIQCSFEV